MTIEKLCWEQITPESSVSLTAQQWESLTDEQILKIFEKSLTVTRPEYAAMAAKQIEPVYIPPAKKRALELLAESGMDMSFLQRRKKK